MDWVEGSQDGPRDARRDDGAFVDDGYAEDHDLAARLAGAGDVPERRASRRFARQGHLRPADAAARRSAR